MAKRTRVTFLNPFDPFFYILMSVLLILLVCVGAFAVIDELFTIPVADQNANTYCKGLGFDQYKSYSRIGILSTVPVGVKCEYAERYTDLGVRTIEVKG